MREGPFTIHLSHAPTTMVKGRVESLVVAVDREIHGTLTDGTKSIAPREKADAATYDVLDEVVGLAVRQGGEVIGAKEKELPEGF